jgi:hypothetical protein
VFDVQEYGAIPNSPGTEFGTAWDAARTALVAAGGGWIWLSRDATGNAHFTARALVTTDSNRCQLPLPKNADNGNKFFVGITGDLATTTPFNYSGRNTPQTNGAIIESTATAETYNNVSIASVLGGPSVALTGTGYEFGFTDIQMMIRNVRVRLPANPSVAAVDFTYVNQADVDLICDTTEILNKTVFTQPTNRQAVGYAAPHQQERDQQGPAPHRVPLLRGVPARRAPRRRRGDPAVELHRLRPRQQPRHLRAPQQIRTACIELCTHGIAGHAYDNGVNGVRRGSNVLSIQTLSIEDIGSSGDWRRPLAHIMDTNTNPRRPRAPRQDQRHAVAVRLRPNRERPQGEAVAVEWPAVLFAHRHVDDGVRRRHHRRLLTTAADGSAVPAPTTPWGAWAATRGTAWRILNDKARIGSGASGNQVQRRVAGEPTSPP